MAGGRVKFRHQWCHDDAIAPRFLSLNGIGEPLLHPEWDVIARHAIDVHGASVGFDEHFRARHGLDLGAVARAYGARVTRVSSSAQLQTVFKEAFTAPGLSVVHVPIDADRALARRREIESRVVAAAVAR